jgi:hypothetical protein
MRVEKRKLIPFIVFFLFYFFFLLTLANNFSAPHDAIDYLNAIETGKDLFNPHHVLYHITTYWLLSVLKTIFTSVPHFYLIEAIDGFWGAMILTVVFLFFRRRFQYDAVTSFLATCLPAFSFGMWFYSTNIEVYMPPLFFLLLSLYIISKARLLHRDIYCIIGFHVMAILFHQANILFTPIVLWRLWKNRESTNFLSASIRYALIGGGSVALVYLFIGRFVLHNNSLAAIIHWMRGYTNESTYWFPLSFSTLLNAFVGLSHAFVGAHFLFRVSFVENYLNSKFFYHNLTDELFVVQALSHRQAMFLFILSVVLALMIFGLVIFFIIKRKRIFSFNRTVMIPLLLFLLIYSIFFYFWMPENLEFWIPQMVVIWLVLAGSLNTIRFGSSKKILFGVIAALLLTINYFGSIRWLTDFKYDLFYAKTNLVKNVATKNDLILLEDGWIIQSYLEYYTHAPVKLIPAKDSANQRVQIDSLVAGVKQRQGKIFIYTDKTFMHAINNPMYVDSLIQSANKLDSITGSAGKILVLQ